MKIVKKLFYVLILFVVVSIIAMTVFVSIINPNKLKPLIAQEITKQTGYHVLIDGDLSWSFYPRLGVKAQHMAFNEPGKEAFVDLREVLIATDLMQLFKGQQVLLGNVYIASVRLMNWQLTNVHTGLIWRNSILTLKPLTASLYQGTLSGEAHGAQLSSIPHWDWNVELNNIQVKPLLQDINKGESKLNVSGVGHVNMQAVTQGKSKDQMINFLNGTLQFSLNNGVVEGVDLNYLIQAAEAVINRQPIPMPDNIIQTQFDSLTGSAVIKNGLVNTDNLLLLTSAFSTKGEGQINLPLQTLDYHLQITLLQTGKIQFPIPVSINGDLRNPSVKLDPGMLNVEITKEQLEKVKTKVQEEIKKLPAEADKFLKKLIGE